MTPPTQAVIFCGGRGTRLGPMTDLLPKPMAPVLGRPFLSFLIDQLRRSGFSEVVLLTGYLGERIQDYFGDGSRFGITNRYSHGATEWETGQRLWESRELLQPRFLLMYADNFTPFRLGPICRRHETTASSVTLTVARKDRGNIRLCPDGKVELYDPTRQGAGLTHVEIGYMLVERDPILPLLDGSQESFSLVLEHLVRDGRLGAFEQGDVYHSISDPERWKLTEEYLRPKSIILLDRDGIINRRPPRGEYVTCQKDFEWIPEHVQVFQDLATQGFEFIVISNQAGIARGIMTREVVDELHAWMKEELAGRGIIVRDILICPHYIHDGCSCRKPLPGMFFEVSRRHALRLDRTIYVGDDVRDAQAANAAGCPCLLVGEVEDIGKLGEVDSHVRQAASLLQGLPWLKAQFAAWGTT